MNLRNIVILFGIIAFLMTGFSPKVAFGQVVDGPIARAHLERQVANLLYQEKYEQLEKMAQGFRSTKERFPDGVWKLPFFYNGLSTPKNRSPEGWERFFTKLNRWQEKYPASVTARVSTARAWISFGEEARGFGYTTTVTPEGWRLLGERVGKANALLKKRPRHPSKDCPERYNALLIVANIQGWGRQEYDTLFREAIAFEPSYQPYYLNKTIYLLPKWHGKRGEWQKFAKDATKLTPESEGSSVYARLVLSLWDEMEGKTFKEKAISWERVKQGFVDNERNYPHSPWVLNNFCKLACIAGDKETARKLFARIGDSPYIQAWSYTKQVAEYKKYRDWALGDNNPEESSAQISFPQGTEDFRQMMFLAKGGDSEAQYQIARMYTQGEFVAPNETEAVNWYLKAAEQGHVGAQVSLGGYYSSGSNLGASRLEQSAKWYYAAAIQGDSNAASSLAYMHFNELGVYGTERDLVQAYVWFSLISQWTEPKVKEVAAQLTRKELAQAEVEIHRIKDEIRANISSAEVHPLFLEWSQIPKIKFNVVPIKITKREKRSLPTVNLLDGGSWQFFGEAQASDGRISLQDGGKVEVQINVGAISEGCVLVGAQLKHSRPQAITGGAPFFLEETMYQGQSGVRLGMGLLAPPNLKEKIAPWYQASPISSLADGIKITFGTASEVVEDAMGSRTELSDVSVMIFPTCEDAKVVGERLYGGQ